MDAVSLDKRHVRDHNKRQIKNGYEARAGTRRGFLVGEHILCDVGPLRRAEIGTAGIRPARNDTAIFATFGLPSEEKPLFWGDVLAGISGKLHTDTFGADTFDGRIEYGAIGQLKLCRVEASRHRVTLSPDLARTEQAPLIKVVLQLKGHSIYEQAGERLVLSPGDCLAYDVSHPYNKAIPSWSRHLVVVIPKDIAVAHGFDIGRLSTQKFSARHGVGRVAYDIVASAFEEIPSIAVGCEAELAQTMLHLLCLPLSQSAISRGGRSQASFSERAKALIRQNLRDPELSIGQIAASLGCSKRYLHMSFATEGTTITDHIWMARLEQCLMELAQPRRRARTITDIAFSWGFSSSSHFSHVFKRRFGFAPSSLLKDMSRMPDHSNQRT